MNPFDRLRVHPELKSRHGRGRRMKKKKILIVDDEVDFTDMVKMNLEMAGGYNVKVENKGASALLAAKKFKPDLIFLDIIMPDMDGGAVLFGLRNDKEVKDVPVVFLTAIVSGSESGSLDNSISGQPFLAKPVTVSQIIECISRTLG